MNEEDSFNISQLAAEFELVKQGNDNIEREEHKMKSYLIEDQSIDIMFEKWVNKESNCLCLVNLGTWRAFAEWDFALCR